ncbi:MAG: hypothetical protein COB73_00735 [Flavobacteriaceae bacterium]|nr:MAG: hypothetical protein COB73_00735 [Flavobacteriaceae bacterium]
MSKELDEFDRLLHQRQKEAITAQIIWAKVKSVDWDKKLMIVEGLVDGLEYFDVSLGLSSFYRKPKVGTKCRLGILENKSSASFLIDADEFEEGIFTSGDSVFTIKESGFIIKQGNESLKDIIDDMIDELNKILVIQGNTIDVAAMLAIKLRLSTVLTA